MDEESGPALAYVSNFVVWCKDHAIYRGKRPPRSQKNLGGVGSNLGGGSKLTAYQTVEPLDNYKQSESPSCSTRLTSALVRTVESRVARRHLGVTAAGQRPRRVPWCTMSAQCLPTCDVGSACVSVLTPDTCPLNATQVLRFATTCFLLSLPPRPAADLLVHMLCCAV